MVRFGTDGWRAIIAGEFNFTNVVGVCQAIAEYVIDQKQPEAGLVVGYDPRFLADAFAWTAANVFVKNGIPVYLPTRDLPTPLVAFMVREKKAAGAVMFTASHNPAAYCGLKFIPDYAGPASLEITQKIEAKLAQVQFETFDDKAEFPRAAPAGLLIKTFDPATAYFNHLKNLIDFPRIAAHPLKIVYDPMYGAGREFLRDLLELAGCRVSLIHGERDPLFGGSEPEPKEETLHELCQEVQAQKADLGLATDGDADRFGIVDDNGHFRPTNDIALALIEYLVKVKKLPGALVRTIATSPNTEKLAESLGRQVYLTPVGFKYIAEIMLREPVFLGFEQSSGLSLTGHIPEKDGLLAGLLVVEMIAYYRQPLSRIISQVKDRIGAFCDLYFNLPLAEAAKQKLLDHLRSARQFGQLKIVRTETIDGVKVTLEDTSWFLVRASGTESLVRLYLEAPTIPRLRQLNDQVRQLVAQY